MHILELIKINHIVSEYEISSRTLRYYEEAGLLWSHRPGNGKLRYYDDQAVHRLEQILLLRKMQIPVKEIAAIYQSGDSADLISAFMNKISAIDEEIEGLLELRSVVDEFLQQMIQRGITKISGILLLQEETEKRLKHLNESGSHQISAAIGTAPLGSVPYQEPKTAGRESLDNISLRPLLPQEVRIIRLPPMEMLTSVFMDGTLEPFEEAVSNLSCCAVEALNGMRQRFYVRMPGDRWKILTRIPEDYINLTPYLTCHFCGGLFAVTSCFMEDMEISFKRLRTWAKNSPDFELDTDENGNLVYDEMLEELYPEDITELLKKYHQDLFVPIRVTRKNET